MPNYYRISDDSYYNIRGRRLMTWANFEEEYSKSGWTSPLGTPEEEANALGIADIRGMYPEGKQPDAANSSEKLTKEFLIYLLRFYMYPIGEVLLTVDQLKQCCTTLRSKQVRGEILQDFTYEDTKFSYSIEDQLNYNSAATMARGYLTGSITANGQPDPNAQIVIMSATGEECQFTAQEYNTFFANHVEKHKTDKLKAFATWRSELNALTTKEAIKQKLGDAFILEATNYENELNLVF